MNIEYLKILPIELKAAALELYFNSLKEKIEPVLGNYSKAQEALISNLATDRCLVAISDNRVVGVLGIQTIEGGFINPTLEQMVKVYGTFGGFFRLIGLALLNHKTSSDELYIDGVAVAEEMRGKGIGSQLIKTLDSIALENEIRTVSLEVVDSNPRAESLYERLGFEAVKRRTIWPLDLFFKFPFRSATLMIKKVDSTKQLA